MTRSGPWGAVSHPILSRVTGRRPASSRTACTADSSDLLVPIRHYLLSASVGPLTSEIQPRHAGNQLRWTGPDAVSSARSRGLSVIGSGLIPTRVTVCRVRGPDISRFLGGMPEARAIGKNRMLGIGSLTIVFPVYRLIRSMQYYPKFSQPVNVPR